MITPTVGRVVYYWDSGVGPMASIIAKVHDDRLVNLTVCGPENGEAFGRTSVVLRQPEDDDDYPAYCEWMPYQVKKDTGSESGEKAAGTDNI